MAEVSIASAAGMSLGIYHLCYLRICLTKYSTAKLEADTQRTRAEGLQGTHPSLHRRSTAINYVLIDLKRLLGQGRRVSKL